MSDARDAGYDDFLDALEEGDPFYLESESGGWLPPREFDPETGSRELSREQLPEGGEIISETTTYVASPDFVDDAPFVVAIADFGPVQITGQVRGVEPEEVEIGDEITLDIDETETTGDRVLVFDAV